MPRILDLQISTPRLIGRVILAFVLAGIDFFIFYVLISPKDTFILRYLPANVSSTLSNTMSSFVSPTLPLIGLFIVGLIFLSQIFKGTRIEGGFVMLMGGIFAWYTYAIFQGGTMNLNIPTGLIRNVSGNITLHATLLMWLLILPSVLSVSNGAMMLYFANGSRSQPVQAIPTPQIMPSTLQS